MALLLILMIGLAVYCHWQLGQLRRRLDLVEALAKGVAPIAPASPSPVTPPAPRPVEAATPPRPSPEPPPAPRPAAQQAAIPVASTRDEQRPPPPSRPIAKPVVPAKPIGFEELFGRRLPIWAGGITLAIAGMLIVKYSIDAGLISPLVRVIAGTLFGTGLIVGAEAALRAEARVRDPRVAQSLAGAGTATLYATVLIAANLYHLIGPMSAFIGLAGVTALAMGLSLRFGNPSALLALGGGLAAPALVGSTTPNIPLLTTYLALTVSGLCLLGRRDRQGWLGTGALVGGLGWSALLLLSGKLDTAATISIAAYLVLLGVLLPLPARSRVAVKFVSATIAATQMAALVASGGFSLLHWGLFALISLAILWLSGREPLLRRLPAVGTAIALLLLLVWPHPLAGGFALAAIGLGLIYALPALYRLWRPAGGIVEAAQIAAIAIGGLMATYVHVGWGDPSLGDPLAGLALLLGAIVAGAATLGWRHPQRLQDLRFPLLITSTGLLAAAASALALPDWYQAPVIAGLGAGLLLVANASRDRRVEISGWFFAVATISLLVLGESASDEWRRLAGQGTAPAMVDPAFFRWGVFALVMGLFAWRAEIADGRKPAQLIAALFGYAACAQLVPPPVLPLVPSLAFAALLLARRTSSSRLLLPAAAGLLGLALLWALGPTAIWAAGALSSAVGQPLLLPALPALRETFSDMMLPALMIGLAAALSSAARPLERRVMVIASGVILALCVHILFRHMVVIASLADFVRLGMAERTLWEALLLMAGAVIWAIGRRRAGLCFAGAGFAHLIWYTLLLHNPLWAGQAVGPAILVNLLLPAYLLPLIALRLVRAFEARLAERFDRALSIAEMLLILLFAFSTLRQMFTGTLLTLPGVSDAEDIARSLLLVGLGVGFLIWGIAKGLRDWRIASLLLMLSAAGKVFLLDAAALEGLARIGSFLALGFSLIGIGWLYGRFVKEDAALIGAQ